MVEDKEETDDTTQGWKQSYPKQNPGKEDKAIQRFSYEEAFVHSDRYQREKCLRKNSGLQTDCKHMRKKISTRKCLRENSGLQTDCKLMRKKVKNSPVKPDQRPPMGKGKKQNPGKEDKAIQRFSYEEAFIRSDRYQGEKWLRENSSLQTDCKHMRKKVKQSGQARSTPSYGKRKGQLPFIETLRLDPELPLRRESHGYISPLSKDSLRWP
ncbi:hypothetical protein CEXT_578071 [Caerostris extrusa]|uniref:Uncharacterized protein n=1 Tax=Caerostris extrusa TaxID=172846 RepID=A0AAV4Y6Z4_CAEEX|nr:hypothetical protein CEXT_578071 [Caerostris extrusa]